MSLNRNPIHVNETFTLEIRSDNTDAAPPAFQLPEGIEQLQRNNISSRSIVNGRISAEQRWVYKLVARKPGDYRFDAVKIGKDITNSLTLTVNQKSEKDTTTRSAKLLLRADIDKQDVYLQQQVILSIKLYRAVPVRFAQITEPQPPNVLIQQMGDDTEYETEENGQTYFVLERRYALYPQKAGRIDIAPVQFNGDITVSTSNSLFGAIADTEPVSLQTAPLHINVSEALTTPNWLPAKHVELTATVLPANKKVQAGEPLTINLSLMVAGQIAANVPALSFSDQEGWHYYPDQVKDAVNMSADGINLERTQKIAVVPTRAGTLQLPPIELPWYNTQTGTQETARVEFEPITVVAADSKTPAPIVVAPAPIESAPAPTTATTPVAASTNYWPWISTVLALLWIVTLLAWWWHMRARQHVKPRVNAPTHAAPDAIKTALVKACKEHDAHTAQHSLLAWARELLQQPDLSWAQLRQRSAPFNDVLQALDNALYSPSPTPWQGDALLNALDALARCWQTPAQQNAASTLNP